MKKQFLMLTLLVGGITSLNAAEGSFNRGRNKGIKHHKDQAQVTTLNPDVEYEESMFQLLREQKEAAKLAISTEIETKERFLTGIKSVIKENEEIINSNRSMMVITKLVIDTEEAYLNILRSSLNNVPFDSNLYNQAMKLFDTMKANILPAIIAERERTQTALDHYKSIMIQLNDLKRTENELGVEVSDIETRDYNELLPQAKSFIEKNTVILDILNFFYEEMSGKS